MLSDVIWVIQLTAAAMGLVLYVASFFGYGWEAGVDFLTVAFVGLSLTSLVTALRDRRFFLRYWGFGFLRLRQEFPLQWFPARRVEWLDPLGWALFALVLFHFLMLMLTSSTGIHSAVDSPNALRCASLMVAVTGLLSALAWIYPPTEKPRDGSEFES